MKLTHISIEILLVSLFVVPSISAQAPVATDQNAASPAPAASAAEVPRLIKFSGTLQDAQEQPLAGPVGVTFALYAHQSGGTALWMETQNVKPDANGNYAVFLGASSANGVPTELFVSGEARWLGIQVGQQPEHDRILLVSVPYALKAKDADTVGGLPASAFLLAQPSSNSSATVGTTPVGGTPTSTKTEGTATKSAAGQTVPAAGPIATNYLPVFTNSTGSLGSSTMYQSGSNIGVGTTTPAVAVDVVGNNAGLRLSGTGTHQVTVTGATSGRLGQDANGFFFASDTNGASVRFLTNNGTLNEWMRITSAGNVGVGTTTPTTKLNVTGSTANQIIYASQTGPGISNASFANLPPIAILGDATHATGLTVGVAGRSQAATGGVGVVGVSTGATPIVSGGNRATGVLAAATATTGKQSGIESQVYSTSATPTTLGDVIAARFTNYGSGLVIEGNGPAASNTCTSPPCSTSVFTVDVNGNVSAKGNTIILGNLNVTGMLSKGGGSLKIDHPLDPEHKILYHSFVESPDMKNVYDGVVTLDVQGRAWVELPAYFEALNKDFRYQLTAIGAPAPNLYVAEEIRGNRFLIMGGKPGGKVSWQVAGTRQDAFAEKYRIRVEEEKPAAEQGFYLYPEAYGQPEEKGVAWARTQQIASKPSASEKEPEAIVNTKK